MLDSENRKEKTYVEGASSVSLTAGAKAATDLGEISSSFSG